MRLDPNTRFNGKNSWSNYSEKELWRPRKSLTRLRVTAIHEAPTLTKTRRRRHNCADALAPQIHRLGDIVSEYVHCQQLCSTRAHETAPELLYSRVITASAARRHMATATVSNGVSTDSGMPPVPIKRRPGRPTREEAAAKRAAELKGQEVTAAATARPPVGEADFWIWLAQRTPDEWLYTICYLWRVEPITDKRMGGKPTSVGKYARPFDIQKVMEEYGSGAYRLDVCEVFPNGGGSKRLRQEYFTIVNLDYPPKVPLGDWIKDQCNEVWKWAEPKLRASQAVDPEPTTAPGAFDPQQMFDSVLNGVRTLRGESNENNQTAAAIIEMVRDNQDKMMELADPAKQLTTLKNLMEAISPRGNTAEDSAMKMVVDMLRDELRSAREEIKEKRQEKSKPVNFIDQVRELVPALKELNTSLGIGTGKHSSGTDWGAVVGGVFEKLSDNLPTIIAFMANQARSAAANPGAQSWPQGQPGRALGAAPQPAANPSAPQAQPVELPPGVTIEQAQQEERILQGLLDRYGPLIMECAPFIVDQFQTANGYDFRDWFLERKGNDTWTALKNECGAERLAALSQLHPVMKQKLAPMEKFVAFLKEFFTPVGEEPEGAFEPDPEPDHVGEPESSRPS